MDVSPAADLPSLRAELGALDHELLSLVARRQALARAVGAVKDEEGRAIRDYAQEREVLDRAERTADALGLPRSLARELSEALIRHAVTAQEEQRVRRRNEGKGRTALVIGGAGRMGGWFTRFLASQGFAVTVADPEVTREDDTHLRDWRQAALSHDLVIVAAPMRASAAILLELAERRPSGVVCDVGSLKSPLREALRTLVAAGVRATSLHPMFGPDTALLSGRQVVLVDLGVPDANAAVAALFAPTMATVVPMALDAHDRAIAYLLGVSHALNIAFAGALADSVGVAGELRALSSTTYAAQLDVAARVVRENPHVYFEIQACNDYGLDALGALRASMERLEAIVRARDEDAFVAQMARGAAFVAGRAS
ncbi:MAG: bifunctional chorismate mutase/prephenate dehydrogenase [Gemmatimonadaceae bacterium]|jgi:chorismate mutase/prephenate dehydrogenase|nr:bifunctional chorismate mutase/prephenate dehydrogenase [Gemmatimonadaceae bacterium]